MQQQENIEKCKKNNWSIPILDISNPAQILEDIKAAKKEREERSKRKSFVIMILLCMIATLVLILAGMQRFNNVMTRIPLDSADFIGQSVTDIYDKLDGTGFNNIVEKVDNSGIYPNGIVLSVSINGNDNFSEGKYVKKDSEIIITCSSTDRIDATELFKNWASISNYQTLFYNLKAAGFTNINTTKTGTLIKSKNMKIASLLLNETEYSSGECYIPKNAQIYIDYYVYQIEVGKSAEDFKNNDKDSYLEAVEYLKNLGFENIHLYRNDKLKTGVITKEGSVEKISIGGKSDFSESDKFYYNTQIDITVNTFKNGEYNDVMDVEE
jgi:hypothetical protein